MAAGTPRAARPGPAPGQLSPSGGGHRPANPRRGFCSTDAGTGTYLLESLTQDTQQRSHWFFSVANDALFSFLLLSSLLPYCTVYRYCTEQRLASAPSKAWIELGACGPDNPAAKASGADLLLLWTRPWMMAMCASEMPAARLLGTYLLHVLGTSMSERCRSSTASTAHACTGARRKQMPPVWISKSPSEAL